MVGQTPLMLACIRGHKDIASHLIEHGEQLHLFSCCVNCCMLKRRKQNVILCEGEESSGCPSSLHERCNLTC